MEYKLKLVLLDEKGNEIISSQFTESGLKQVMHNTFVTRLKYIMNEMKRQHIAGSTYVEWPKYRTLAEEMLLVIEDELKDRRKHGISPFKFPPINDDGILVTWGDVEEYTAITGVDQEMAYKKLKAFYLGETDTL